MKKKINIHPTLKFLKYFPKIDKNVNISHSAKIIGNTFIKEGTKILDNVIIRGDGEKIEIGKKCILNRKCTVHVASDFLGTSIGNNCVIEQFSVIHACCLGNNVTVGENSIVMDGAVVGDNSIILPDTLIPPGKKFDNYSLISGSPAKLIKKINNEYYNKNSTLNKKSTKSYQKYVNKINPIYKSIDLQGNKIFLSKDTELGCKIIAKNKSSIWFSSIMHSPNSNGVIILGEGSNIQDNSILNTNGKKIEIGKRVTIGHNVIINGETQICDDAVIGMGSILEEKCLVEKGAFVGANSYVNKSTIIPEGQIFAGNPAKFFRDVTSKEKKFFSLGQKIYEKLTGEYIKINY